ncbi:dihydropteroate synthase [Haladaptatus sp. DYSN1]|uniref:dihydropteroate synthase n=1 Tax=unclassified Haladaptatus TaxID=2622732 RepID=UPI002406AC22|nr:dihydropteroate synthase [Haladaptatus sp. DYSN1]
MEFHDAANFLFDLRRFTPRAGTEATRDLLDHLGSPDEDVAFVQVAGSNGKGSTVRMVESTLREAGLNVGLYTSPHLEDVRERVRVNGRMISKRGLVRFVEEAKPYLTEAAARGESPTFFETLTALAIWEFARQDVDVAVLEVGIGGKYDATSAVDPIASAVTNVSLEHTQYLGDTVEEIATDKAHVASGVNPLVTAATGSALDAVRAQAGDVVTVGTDGADVTVTYEGRDGLEGRISLAGPDWNVDARLPMVGAHQATNAGVAAVLARQVADVEERTLARGLRKAFWPGRFEIMSQEPLTVLDGAHNPGACEVVADVLAEFEYENLHLVFGAMSDKDHQGMVDALPTPDSVVTCQPDMDRAEDRAVLASIFEERGVSDVERRSAVESAVELALSKAGPEDCVLMTGSLFVVAEARRRWTRVEIPKRIVDLDAARDTLAGAHVTAPGVWRMRGKGVHRVLKTRVQKRQAQYLKEELLSLGGECALSGLNDQDEETFDVVLMGTLAQFKRLADKLDGQPYGLSHFADDIREALSIQTQPESLGYPWEDHPVVMGILNVTPDSFHDGGRYEAVDDAVSRAKEMLADGAEIIDVGGESTRPGAEEVSIEDEIARVVPVIEQLADLDCLISIDTRKAAVARAALDAGAHIINDVTGLGDPEMRFVAAEYDAPVVVMHSLDAPVVPEHTVEYDDVVEDVIEELKERVLLAEKAGLDRRKIIVDPGLGFGKSPAENFEILGRAGEFHALGCPVLIGHSHKSMFGLIGQEKGDRLAATVAGTTLAVERGADIVRVHDVKENVAAVRAALAARDPARFD